MIAPGQVFAGDYRVIRELGRGGMGAVYVVEQLSTGKQRALKLMSARLLSDAKAAERFLLEARVGSRVESEHVVEVIAAGIDESGSQRVPWLVMELLEGQSLEEAIATGGPMDPERAHEVLRQLCHGLGAAHRAGLVHRDVKPDNVFLARSKSATEGTKVKLLDFGIAKVLSPTVGEHGGVTAPMGTPTFMAPEQTRRGEVDARADVWALGLVAYYVLTGTHYWRAANTPDAPLTALLVEISADPIEAPSTRAASQGRRLPEGFDEWFLRCVDRDLDRRYPDADAAWRALAGRLSGDAFAATLSSDALASASASTAPATPTPAPVATPAPSAPPAVAAQPPNLGVIALGAGALMLVIGGAAVGWSMQRGDPAPPPPTARVEASAPPDAGAAMAAMRPPSGAPSPPDAGPPDAGAREPEPEAEAAAHPRPRAPRLSPADRAARDQFVALAQRSCRNYAASHPLPGVRVRFRQWLNPDGSRVRWQVEPREVGACLNDGPAYVRWAATGAPRTVEFNFLIGRTL